MTTSDEALVTRTAALFAAAGQIGLVSSIEKICLDEHDNKCLIIEVRLSSSPLSDDQSRRLAEMLGAAIGRTLHKPQPQAAE